MPRRCVARPRPDLPAGDAIRALADSEGRLAVRVTPGASADGLAIDGCRLLVRVRAVPDSGKANAAVLSLLARALDLAPSRLELLRGGASREKLVRIPVENSLSGSKVS
jgi:uncharacterized protein